MAANIVSNAGQYVVAHREHVIRGSTLARQRYIRSLAFEREKLQQCVQALGAFIAARHIGNRVLVIECFIGSRALARERCDRIGSGCRYSDRSICALTRKLEHGLRSLARTANDVVGIFTERVGSLEQLLVRLRPLRIQLRVCLLAVSVGAPTPHRAGVSELRRTGHSERSPAAVAHTAGLTIVDVSVPVASGHSGSDERTITSCSGSCMPW